MNVLQKNIIIVIIIIIIIIIVVIMKNGNKLYADLIGFESTSSLFENSRPDACIVTANGELLPLELTVCHELNFEKARNYKKNDTVTLGKI